MQLFPQQQDLKERIYAGWHNNKRNVCAVLPTGGGKTVLFSDILKNQTSPSIAIAHRQELVCQISLALARNEVRHRIIAPKSVIRLAINLHRSELNLKDYYDPSARCGVAGVDTLVRRQDNLENWANSVGLWVQDECHHVLASNKWGKACSMFPNARGLGVTATPVRADGKGLGRAYDGLFDYLAIGESMRWHIDNGYLTDYRVFSPPSDLNLDTVKVSETTGDFVPAQASLAVKKSTIIGDVVSHYLKICPGKLGVTFAPNVEIATTIAAQFNSAGVPAEVVSAKTPEAERIRILRNFKTKKILQLVNVDLFGEGFDLPAIEVVSMARPTKSFGLYCQQFGRALRFMEGKKVAYILDHVGNVSRHGLPDAKRSWSLERRTRRSRRDLDEEVIPTRVCTECLSEYERIHKGCPYCGHVPIPAVRKAPEQVDGDLLELDSETLTRLRGEVDAVNKDKEDYRLELTQKRMPYVGQLASVKRHVARQDAQKQLRESIAWWAGHLRAKEKTDSEIYRRFFFRFGVDILSAQALGAEPALSLETKIKKAISEEI